MSQIQIIPDVLTVEINRALAVGVIFIMCAVAPTHAEEAANRFESQLAPVAPAPAGEWWKASWREGWTYQHRGDFTLSARAKIRNKEDVSWWRSLLTSGAVESIGEINLEVRGNSQAESGVLRSEADEILLTRFYPRADVTRAIFRKAVGDPTIVDKVLNSMVDDKVRLSFIKTIMGGALGLAGGTGGIPTGVVGKVVGDWVGERANDLVGAELKKHGIQKRPDGGIEIDPDSSWLRSIEATQLFADVANLAMQLNEAFSRRAFLILASTKSGDELETREIFSEGDDLVAFTEMAENGGRSKAVDWLKSRMPGYNEPEGLVRGVFQRETFALSSNIFDAQERRHGDVWVVSGEFFNSFLHPDLQGTFRGNVVLHYVRDAKVPHRYDEKVVFDARVIEILYEGSIDGRTHQSTLEYTEPGFSAKLREDTEGVLFIDKADGFLRQANLIMDSEARSNLPEMKILQGFEAVGNARFEVIYTCTGGPTG